MHGEQILHRARGWTDAFVSGREKQEDLSEIQGRCWAEAMMEARRAVTPWSGEQRRDTTSTISILDVLP